MNCRRIWSGTASESADSGFRDEDAGGSPRVFDSGLEAPFNRSSVSAAGAGSAVARLLVSWRTTFGIDARMEFSPSPRRSLFARGSDGDSLESRSRPPDRAGRTPLRRPRRPPTASLDLRCASSGPLLLLLLSDI